jgi:DNA-directed RNA polymerase specialized sigma24 family protein
MMTIGDNASSHDDAVGERRAPAEDGDGLPEKDVDQPWWADDRAVIAARESVDTWLESREHDSPREDDSYAVHNEVMNGSCWRELRRARDDLERARARYADAIEAARAVGFSWGEIGRVLGVPRQLLHRRFRRTSD